MGSAVVAAGLDSLTNPMLSPGQQKILALSIAAASAVLAALNPQQRAKAYRTAWIELDQAIKKGADVDDSYLQALAVGEHFIGLEAERQPPSKKPGTD